MSWLVFVAGFWLVLLSRVMGVLKFFIKILKFLMSVMLVLVQQQQSFN